MSPTMKENEILLVYDRECPFCHNYSQLLVLRENVGKLSLINAREPHPVVDEIRQLGMELNEGMVVKMSERYYYGADAIHILALMSSRSGLFNRLNYCCFKSNTISNILYPILRCGRNLVLKLLGKTKIQHGN